MNILLAAAAYNFKRAMRVLLWLLKIISERQGRSDFSLIKAFSSPEALVSLFKKVIAPTPNKAVVVTTNYDRLPEYAISGIFG